MREIDPKETNRAATFDLWMNAPMPMVTLIKTLNVTNLVKISRKHHLKFNMLMCWCIGKAASQTKEFYLLPVGEKLMQYDKLAVNTIVTTKDGDIGTCDLPYSDDFQRFAQDYMRLTQLVHDTSEAYDASEDHMVIGTSALTQTEIDGAINIYAGFYNNPFLIWGRRRKKFLHVTLPLSFQFHHTQMDGAHAAQFLETLQQEIRSFKP